MLLLEKIQKVIDSNSAVADRMYQADSQAIKVFDGEVTDVIKLINVFMSILPALNQMGLDVPKDVIDVQIANLEEGLKNKDFMLLADCLKYEVNDTLQVFKELVEEGVVKNEEFL